MSYNPNQKREPGGSDIGGQFASQSQQRTTAIEEYRKKNPKATFAQAWEEVRRTNPELFRAGGANLFPTKMLDGKLMDMDGNPLPSHIAALKIPPGWKEVHINPDAEGSVLAQGLDSKGRPQSIYSEAHQMRAAAAKFSRIRELQTKRLEIHNQNESNLKSGNERTKENAIVHKLITQTGIRPGSDTNTQAKVQAYGATTLEGRHVVEEGGAVRLKFTGKKGVALNIPVEDEQMATILKLRKAAAGDSGKLFKTDDAALRDYAHTLDGGKFKPKDFRTLKGTTTAAEEIARRPVPTTKAEYLKAVKEVAKVVAGKLGNTPAVSLQSYIDPTVFHPWRKAA